MKAVTFEQVRVVPEYHARDRRRVQLLSRPIAASTNLAFAGLYRGFVVDEGASSVWFHGTPFISRLLPLFLNHSRMWP